MSGAALRRAPATTPRLAISRPAEPRVAPARRASATLLLVEDDPEVRALFGSFLRHAGYLVVDVANGAEALVILRDRHAHVDAVITDVVLSYVDGPALVSAVRDTRPDVPVLYVSGFDVETEVAADDRPPTRHLRKPLTRSALLTEVAALLSPAGARPPRREVASEFD